MVRRGLFGGQYQLVSSEDARKIHYATLEILESTGMHCPSEKIMKVFKYLYGKLLVSGSVHDVKSLLN